MKEKKLLYDVAIVGAGPIGIACAIEAKKLGLKHIVFEKGYIVNSLYYFPQNMTFFSTAPELEIGGIPFIVQSEKPKRVDALKYYWRVAKHFELNIKLHTNVSKIEKLKNGFLIKSRKNEFKTRTVILAIGYYDNPNLLNVPGEDFPHVSHRYSDPHCYINKKVIVIGANNSAVEASLELYRYGVDVELVHRGSELGKGIKYWVLPDIQNRIKNNEIPAWFNTTVKEITPTSIVLKKNTKKVTKKADAVLSLTGYHPDFIFMQKCGIKVKQKTSMPDFNPENGETNVSGLYIAGALQVGKDANKIFIENGRHHAPIIAKSIHHKII